MVFILNESARKMHVASVTVNILSSHDCEFVKEPITLIYIIDFQCRGIESNILKFTILV